MSKPEPSKPKPSKPPPSAQRPGKKAPQRSWGIHSRLETLFVELEQEAALDPGGPSQPAPPPSPGDIRPASPPQPALPPAAGPSGQASAINQAETPASALPAPAGSPPSEATAIHAAQELSEVEETSETAPQSEAASLSPATPRRKARPLVKTVPLSPVAPHKAAPELSKPAPPSPAAPDSPSPALSKPAPPSPAEPRSKAAAPGEAAPHPAVPGTTAIPSPAGAGLGRSALQVPVRLQEGATSLLEIIDDTPGRLWTEDEKRLVEQVADQLSLALENARLFEQIQANLAETESLYLASAELNTAQSYDDILAALRKATILGDPAASDVTIHLFDRPWKGMIPPDFLIPIARWSREPYPEPSSPRSPLREWTSARQYLLPESPTIITYPETDPRLDATVRARYLDRLNAQSLVFAPLVVAGQWIGHIIAAYTGRLHCPPAAVRRLVALAGQSAVSVQNLRLYAETNRRAAQLETAAEIARDTSGTLALDVLLKRAVNAIRDRYGFYHASIFLLDETNTYAVIRASTGDAGEEMKRTRHHLRVGSRSVIGHVTETGRLLVINDVEEPRGESGPIHLPNPLLPETRAEIGIPLMIGSRVIGALDVQSRDINAFSEDDAHVLQTLADQIAVAVDNARSYELAQQAVHETQQRVQELSVLYNVSQNLASVPMESGPREPEVMIAEIVARRFIEIMSIPQCSVSLFDHDKDAITTLLELRRDLSGKGFFENPSESGAVYRLADYPAMARVLETLQPTIIQTLDPQADPAELANMRKHEPALATVAIIPMAVKGEALGIIELEVWAGGESEPGRNFSSSQINLASILANNAAVALENARLYAEQRRTGEKLRELDKLKSQFLANMSHELRTPLNSIIGFSRVIIKGIDGPITEQQLQDLNAIYSAGQHLLSLINAVLDISKIEAGKMELNMEDNVDLRALINSVTPTATGLLKEKTIQLERVIHPDLPPVRADATRIRQVLINFISNATKFTEDGTITIEAGLLEEKNGRPPEVIVKVIDTGIGISPEDQEKLFQPFSQVDTSPTRKTGGSGLGLSISRLLIEMHGGRIGVESEVGKGSTFYFTLPLSVPQTG